MKKIGFGTTIIKFQTGFTYTGAGTTLSAQIITQPRLKKSASYYSRSSNTCIFYGYGEEGLITSIALYRCHVPLPPVKERKILLWLTDLLQHFFVQGFFRFGNHQRSYSVANQIGDRSCFRHKPVHPQQ